MRYGLIISMLVLSLLGGCSSSHSTGGYGQAPVTHCNSNGAQWFGPGPCPSN